MIFAGIRDRQSIGSQKLSIENKPSITETYAVKNVESMEEICLIYRKFWYAKWYHEDLEKVELHLTFNDSARQSNIYNFFKKM